MTLPHSKLYCCANTVKVQQVDWYHLHQFSCSWCLYICWSRMMIHWDLATGSSASIMTTLFPLITCRWLLVVSIWCYILLPMHSEVHVQKFQTTISKRKPTTIPISVLSFPLTSTVLSTTRFMNWSNPRSVPITTRFAFSLTGEMVKQEQISQWRSFIDGKI